MLILEVLLISKINFVMFLWDDSFGGICLCFFNLSGLFLLQFHLLIFLFFFIFQVVLELSFSLVFSLLHFLFHVLGLVCMSS